LSVSVPLDGLFLELQFGTERPTAPPRAPRRRGGTKAVDGIGTDRFSMVRDSFTDLDVWT